jgi:hypothetical protein
MSHYSRSWRARARRQTRTQTAAKDTTDLMDFKKQFKKTHPPSNVRVTFNAGGK